MKTACNIDDSVMQCRRKRARTDRGYSDKWNHEVSRWSSPRRPLTGYEKKMLIRAHLMLGNEMCVGELRQRLTYEQRNRRAEMCDEIIAEIVASRGADLGA